MVDVRTSWIAWVLIAFVANPSLAAPPDLRLLAVEVNERATGIVAPVLLVDDEVHLLPESFEKLRIVLPDVPAVGDPRP